MAVIVAGALATATVNAPVASASAPSAASWPQFGHGSDADFDNTAEATITAKDVAQLTPVWLSSGVGGESSPIEETGTVYGGCSDTTVCAYSASDGRVKWRAPSAAFLTPAVANGRVFMLCSNWADLCAVDAATGKPVWTAAPNDGGQLASAPIVSHGVIYVGGLNGLLFALSESTGKVLWDFWTNSSDPYAFNPLFGTPVVHGDVVYLSSPYFPLQAVSLTSHRLLWQSTGALSAEGDQTPNIEDGMIVVSSPMKPLTDTAPNVMAFPLAGCGSTLCNPKWSKRVGSDGAQGTATSAQTVFTVGGQRDNTYLYAMNLETGKQEWSALLPVTNGSSTPAVAGDVVYLGTGNGAVDAVAAAGCSRKTCPLLWSRQVDDPSNSVPQPIVVNGSLFVSTSYGLYAFQPAGRSHPKATVPTAPTEAKATQRNALATVTWHAGTSARFPITAYAIATTPSIGGTLPASGRFTNDVVQLIPGKRYTFTVTAESAAGASAASRRTGSVYATDTPGEPTHVKATAGDGQITLTWKPPADTGGLPLTGYLITPNTIGPTANVKGAVSSYTIKGLSNGNAYSFSIQAANKLGAGPQAFSPEATPSARG